MQDATDRCRRGGSAANEAVPTIPEPFFSRMARREKRPLGDLFSLENFGVNLTTLEPGGETALMHSHSKQDEMIYILQGNPTLVTESGEIVRHQNKWDC